MAISVGGGSQTIDTEKAISLLTLHLEKVKEMVSKKRDPRTNFHYNFSSLIWASPADNTKLDTKTLFCHTSHCISKSLFCSVLQLFKFCCFGIHFSHIGKGNAFITSNVLRKYQTNSVLSWCLKDASHTINVNSDNINGSVNWCLQVFLLHIDPSQDF